MDWFANPLILYPLMLILYVGLPALGVFILYKLYKTLTKGRQLGFNTMPNLTHVTSKNLPKELTAKLETIDQKAKKLLGYYDNKQIKDEAIMGENQFLVKKILNTDLPEAVGDYQRLDNTRANQMAVGTTGKTAHQLLNEYLDTINEQFDDMLDAMYEQNAQKLLVANRYLQTRFDNPNSELNVLVNESRGNAPSVPQLAEPQTTGIEIPPPSIKLPETADIKIDK